MKERKRGTIQKSNNNNNSSSSNTASTAPLNFQSILDGVQSVQDHLSTLGESFSKYEGQDHNLFKTSLQDILTVAGSLEQEISRMKQHLISVEQDSMQRYKILIFKLALFLSEAANFLDKFDSGSNSESRPAILVFDYLA